jgi:exodeoxyribonuclease VII small subunit
MTTIDEPANKKFEIALQELEEVVEQLQSGELSLDDALAAFEKGVGLAKCCNQRLSEAESRVELLMRDRAGNFQLKALLPDTESDDSES